MQFVNLVLSGAASPSQGSSVAGGGEGGLQTQVTIASFRSLFFFGGGAVLANLEIEGVLEKQFGCMQTFCGNFFVNL